MEQSYSVKLRKIIDEFHLEILHAAENIEEATIVVDSVDRPGLPLVGFYDHFTPDRVQLVGNVEYCYLNNLSHEERLHCFDELFSYDIPAFIIARGMEPFSECMEMAQAHDRTILRTQEPTGDFMSTLTTSLKGHLSPRITRHGVLLEVYGEGVLLLGESGVGKSENAVELLKRGHRLIADDAVEIKRTSTNTLTGSAPELIRYYVELRGIGVIDVRHLFGMSAVKDYQKIDLVINLEPWKDNMQYDRLGLENLYTTILGIKVPTLTVPVKPGRNLAVIIEVAVLNNRHKKMGYNAAEAFTKQINAHFDQQFSKG